MTDGVEVALIAVPVAVLGLVRDVWIRYRTDCKEAQDRQDRLDKERRDEEEKRRAVALVEDDKRAAVDEATLQTAEALLTLTDSDLRRVTTERDEARENVNVLRVALEQVVGALSADIGRMREELRHRDEKRAEKEERMREGGPK